MLEQQRESRRRKKWGGKANQSNVDQILQIDTKQEEETTPQSIVVPDDFFNVKTPSNLAINDGFRRLSMVKDAEFDIKACRNDSFNAYSNPSMREVSEKHEVESGNDLEDKFQELFNEKEEDDPIMKLL